MFLHHTARSLFCIIIFGTMLICLTAFGHAQASKPKPTPTPKPKPGDPQRLAFADAQRLLDGEKEGNLAQRPNVFSRTRLRTGQILELYYPITAVGASAKAKASSVPGYGLLYESEAAYQEAMRPHHILEDLIPDPHAFVASIPQLTASLQKRLRLGAAALDYSPASLKRIDLFIATYQRAHTTADTDPQLFQELTAYYGETLRRAVNGQWRVSSAKIDRTHTQAEPNIIFESGGASGELKPWDRIVTSLHDDNHKGTKLAEAFSADIEAARDAGRQRAK